MLGNPPRPEPAAVYGNYVFGNNNLEWIMYGWICNLGTAVKEAGERAWHRRLPWADTVIRIGLALRDFAMRKRWR